RTACPDELRSQSNTSFPVPDCQCRGCRWRPRHSSRHGVRPFYPWQNPFSDLVPQGCCLCPDPVQGYSCQRMSHPALQAHSACFAPALMEPIPSSLERRLPESNSHDFSSQCSTPKIARPTLRLFLIIRPNIGLLYLDVI